MSRDRLRTALAMLPVFSTLVSGCHAPRTAGPATDTADRPYRPAALEAARWIQSTERTTAAGKTWPPDPLKPDDFQSNLYGGSAGVVLFFIEAHHATGDRRYLVDARSGADELLARLPDTIQENTSGLYTGVAGSGFVLLEIARATGDDKYRAGAGRCVDLLAGAARRVGNGVEWGAVTDIIGGGAGIGLFLLRAADALSRSDARDLAVAAGRRLIDLGRPADGGIKWAMSPEYPRLMPNFSHGTAGIGYFLATLYRDTGDRAFLDAALGAARYLTAVANTNADGCSVFHHEPGGEDLYYLGWCHGPVGTARLFYRLARVTGDSRWMTWVRRSARSIMTSGIPEKHTPGFWNNAGQCCGSAGVAEFFLDLHRATGDRKYLDFARRVADQLLRRATRDGVGMKWIQAEHRVRPDFLVAQTGYMQGAAGIGMLLLHLDAAERGRAPVVIFPDSPFDTTER